MQQIGIVGALQLVLARQQEIDRLLTSTSMHSAERSAMAMSDCLPDRYAVTGEGYGDYTGTGTPPEENSLLAIAPR